MTIKTKYNIGDKLFYTTSEGKLIKTHRMNNKSTIINKLIECADSLEEHYGYDLTAVKVIMKVATDIQNNKLEYKKTITSLRNEADILQIELGSNLVAVKLMNEIANILEKEML